MFDGPRRDLSAGRVTAATSGRAGKLAGIARPGTLLTGDAGSIAFRYDRTSQVRAIHRRAVSARPALRPGAAGSGLSRGAVPRRGSIVLGLMRMNWILESDRIDAVAADLYHGGLRCRA